MYSSLLDLDLEMLRRLNDIGSDVSEDADALKYLQILDDDN